MPDIKNATPRIPIKLPTNSAVEPNSTSAGAHNNAIKAPTAIMGIPTPKLIALEPMLGVDDKIYMKFMLPLAVTFQLLKVYLLSV